MPLYEYACEECGKTCEIIVRASAPAPVCPACGSGRLARKISNIARPARDGGDDFGDLSGMGCGDGGCGMPGAGCETPGGCCGGSCSGH